MQTNETTQLRPLAGPGDTMETLRRVMSPVATAWRAWWPLAVVVAAYFLVATNLLPFRPRGGLSVTYILQILLSLFSAALVFFVIVRLVIYAREGFPARPTHRLLQDIRKILFNPARLLSFIILFPVIFLFVKAFSAAKANIPHLNPFSWDSFFMQMDRALHGGIDPWRLLEPLIALPAATLFINFFYNFWFLFTIGSLFWLALMPRPDHTRVRYLIAFMLAWAVGGNIIATIFSSAGPVYYERLGLSSDPYGPLMALLHKVAEVVPVWALKTQDMLWELYVAQGVTPGGISAFPSLHNGQATLMALLAWQYNRKLGIAMTLYAALIAIGSVWLGWHYAVDAYAGIALGLACWWLAAPLARWLMQRQAMRELVVLQRKLDSTAQTQADAGR